MVSVLAYPLQKLAKLVVDMTATKSTFTHILIPFQ